MQQHHTFAREDILPSWWANAISRFLSGLVGGTFRIRQVNNTTIEVPAGANEDAVVITIDGKWRWNEATVQRAHPGGAAGTYDIFVTARNNNVVNTPVAGTDNTNYSFDLAIVAAGASPTIVPGTVDIHRKVATLQWTGSAISYITPLVGPDLVGDEAVTNAKLADDAVDARVLAPNSVDNAAMQDDSVGAAEIQAGAVSASEINSSLKPSAGAAAGTEALRKLGTGANDAAAGNDPRFGGAPQPHAAQHAEGGQDPLTGITKAQLAAAVQQALYSPGDIKMSGRSAAETGWLLCDGSTVSRTTYAALFAAIGTEFNTGGEAGTDFRLPDFRGRSPFGVDGSAGRLASNDTLGDVGGAERVTLTAAESGLPAHGHTATQAAHNHTVSDPGHQHVGEAGGSFVTTGNGDVLTNAGTGAANWYVDNRTNLTLTNITINNATPAITVNNAASAAASSSHQNMPPYQIVNFFIKT